MATGTELAMILIMEMAIVEIVIINSIYTIVRTKMVVITTTIK